MRPRKRGDINPAQSSIVLHLGPILAARNISKPTAFLIRAGINNFSVNKMMKGTSVQLNFRQMTQLCLALNCTPNDLLALRDMELPANHQLHSLQTTDEVVVNPVLKFANMSLQEIKELTKQ